MKYILLSSNSTLYSCLKNSIPKNPYLQFFDKKVTCEEAYKKIVLEYESMLYYMKYSIDQINDDIKKGKGKQIEEFSNALLDCLSKSQNITVKELLKRRKQSKKNIEKDEKVKRHNARIERKEKYKETYKEKYSVGDIIEIKNTKILIKSDEGKANTQLASKYRKNPRNQDCAISYAYREAIKLQEPLLVFAGNSYGTALWRVSRLVDFDILACNNLHLIGWLVTSNGYCYTVEEKV